MAEISALSAAPAAAARTDARALRDQQEQNRQRLDLLRQEAAGLRLREQQDFQALDQRRLETGLDDLRTEQEDRRLSEAQTRLLNAAFRDEQGLVRLQDARELPVRAGARDTEAAGPRPEPLAPNPGEGRPAGEIGPPPETPETPETIVPIVGQATSEDQQPQPTPGTLEFSAAGAAETGAFPITDAPAFSDQEVFDLQERDRGQRLAERRESELDQQAQQDIDLGRAEDQIATTPPNTGLPRGAIVDVLG